MYNAQRESRVIIGFPFVYIRCIIHSRYRNARMSRRYWGHAIGVPRVIPDSARPFLHIPRIFISPARFETPAPVKQTAPGPKFDPSLTPGFLEPLSVPGGQRVPDDFRSHITHVP